MGPGPSGPWSEQRAVAPPVLSPSLQMSPGQLLLRSQCVGSDSTSRSIFPSPSVPSVWDHVLVKLLPVTVGAILI